MIENLHSEMINENNSEAIEKSLINLLFQINQIDKAKNGYFEFISRQNKALIKKELGDGNLLSFDVELFARIANEILESNLNALKTFKTYYLVIFFILFSSNIFFIRNFIKKVISVSLNLVFG